MQIRTKFDPLKWPIEDRTTSSNLEQFISSQSKVIPPISEITFCPATKPLSAVPPAPVPRVYEIVYRRPSESESISSSISESLNPDVPEFIPTDLTGRTNGFSTVDESSEMKNDVDSENSKDSESTIVEMSLLPPNNNLPVEINEKSSTTDLYTSNSLSEKQVNEESNSNDNAWQEVTVLF